MGRKLNDWLQAYRQYTESHEGPELWHFWVGLSLLASAVERKVWLDRGRYILYPNLYIISVAEPGVAKKSSSARIGIRLLQELEPGPTITSQKMTTAVLPDIVAESLKITEIDGKPYEHSSVLIFSSELEILLGENPAGGGDIMVVLTDMYDCEDSWSYRRRKAPSTHAKNVCLNILGCTTPSSLTKCLPKRAVGGGFASRVIFVYIDTPAHPVAHPELSQDDEKLYEELIYDLNAIHHVCGKFSWTKKAHDIYAEWYNQDFLGEPTIPDDRFRGYLSRKRDMVIKVAMLAALAEGNELVLEDRHVLRSLGWFEMIEPGMPEAFGTHGGPEAAEDILKVYNAIQRIGRIGHSTLQKRLWRVLGADSKRFNDAISALRSMELIATEMEGRKTIYVIIEGKDLRSS